jgi:hypothetical protein
MCNNVPSQMKFGDILLLPPEGIYSQDYRNGEEMWTVCSQSTSALIPKINNNNNNN